MKLVGHKQKEDFVQTILSDDHEVNALRQCAGHMEEAVRLVVVELVGFTKVDYPFNTVFSRKPINNIKLDLAVWYPAE